MKKCKECGAELAKEDLFCGECGAKVETAAAKVDETKDETDDEAEASEEEEGDSDADEAEPKEEEDDSALLITNIMGFAILFGAIMLFKHDWNKLGAIVAFFSLFFSFANVTAGNKKSRPLLLITLAAWAAVSLYMASNDHIVVAYACLVPLACTTGGLSSIKKKLAIVPLVVTLGVAVALFVLF